METATNNLVVGCKNTTIPSIVNNINYEAFSGCTGLTNLTLPSSVISIGDHAFENCTGLTSINIPFSVTYIGDKAFKSCSGLKSIDAWRIDPEEYHCSIFAFEDVMWNTVTLYVPGGSKSAYQNLSAWRAFQIIEKDSTGIKDVLNPSENVVFNLSGRRVENPQKGLFIVNGKKVLVK